MSNYVTTLTGFTPIWCGEFVTFQDWVNNASCDLKRFVDSNGNPLSAVCMDTLGRRCVNGKDFERARQENAFPVRYFVEGCVLPNAKDESMAVTDNLDKEIDALREAVIAGDTGRRSVAYNDLITAIKRQERDRKEADEAFEQLCADGYGTRAYTLNPWPEAGPDTQAAYRRIVEAVLRRPDLIAKAAKKFEVKP